MKDVEKEYENNPEIKKEKIFEILNKKRKPDTNHLNIIPHKKKKKLFILLHPSTNDSTTKPKLTENKPNMNILSNQITNITNILPQNETSKINQNIFPEIKETNENQNNFKNINIIYNNEINNKDNIDNKIKLIDDSMETQTQYGDYICYSNREIGSGSFGKVLYGKHKSKSYEVAVKIINNETSIESINKEIKSSKQLEKVLGFSIIYYSCIQEKKKIIIESLLGPSLDKLLKYCGMKFPLKTVCAIGKQMVQRLENIHEKGILHRDLKPNNFTWGNYNSSYNKISNYDNLSNTVDYSNECKLDINTIFLIDFGLSCSFLENNNKHYKIRMGQSFVGTLRYASISSHKGIRQGRKDDLESMLYILIYFLKGRLPWQDVKAKQKEERHNLIYKIKSNISVDDLCKDLPNEFSDLLKYVKCLEFDEKPYYCKFYAFFHNLIEKISQELNLEDNFTYMWEKILVDKMKLYNENKDENIIQEAEKMIFKGYPINLHNFTNYIIYNNKNRK